MGNSFSAELAKSNVNLRRKRFSGEIEESINNSIRYSLSDLRRGKADVDFQSVSSYSANIDVVDTGIRYYLLVMCKHMVGRDGKTAILNPGDYVNPGGNYICGDSGYEETICSNTTLYEVLSECNEYYDWNSIHVNRNVYTNVCLYTPNVVVCDNTNNSIGAVDVITCSPPDYDTTSLTRANKAVHDRIELVFNIAVRNGVENLVLCDFGCGKSKSDIVFIANAFYEMCVLYYARFKTITFVMEPGMPYEKFKEVFNT